MAVSWEEKWYHMILRVISLYLYVSFCVYLYRICAKITARPGPFCIVHNAADHLILAYPI